MYREMPPESLSKELATFKCGIEAFEIGLSSLDDNDLMDLEKCLKDAVYPSKYADLLTQKRACFTKFRRSNINKNIEVEREFSLKEINASLLMTVLQANHINMGNLQAIITLLEETKTKFAEKNKIDSLSYDESLYLLNNLPALAESFELLSENYYDETKMAMEKVVQLSGYILEKVRAIVHTTEETSRVEQSSGHGSRLNQNPNKGWRRV